METNDAKNMNNVCQNRSKKGISLIVLVITIIVSLILLSVIVLSIKYSNPTNKADEAIFRNDFVVLQNELTSSKLNEKINDFAAKEDINISMNDDKIYDWLPSLKDSPLKGYVEICNGEVVFIIPDADTDEHKWAEKIAGAEKVCDTSCAEAPKVFSPEIAANVKSGEMSTQAVNLTISGGVSDDTIEHYYEYSLDKGETFEKVTDLGGTSLSFDGAFLRSQKIRFRPGCFLQPPQSLCANFPLEPLLAGGRGFFLLVLQLGIIVSGMLVLLQLAFQLQRTFVGKRFFQRLVLRCAVRSVCPIGKAVRIHFKTGFLYLLLGIFFLLGKIIIQQQFILPWFHDSFTSPKKYFSFFKNSSDLHPVFLLLVRK